MRRVTHVEPIAELPLKIRTSKLFDAGTSTARGTLYKVPSIQYFVCNFDPRDLFAFLIRLFSV